MPILSKNEKINLHRINNKAKIINQKQAKSANYNSIPISTLFAQLTQTERWGLITAILKTAS